MKNRWQNSDAAVAAAQSEVELRVYSSQLLGADSSLVLHGGGNTSVKAPFLNVFGEAIPALYVKGSGWDLRTIKAPGFPPVDLAYLQRLGQLQHLSDSDMMRELRLALLDPNGPTPSVEAILHALIPHKYVDHSHADAVVILSNTTDGHTRLADLYGDEVLILPYVMPGFILAQQVAEATASINWDSIKGIVLLHHGIFTFHEDAEQSYSNMIELVTRAEEYLAANGGSSGASSQSSWQASDAEQVATLRKHAGTLLGSPLLVRTDISAPAAGFAALDNAAELLQRGPLTPDHTFMPSLLAPYSKTICWQDWRIFRPSISLILTAIARTITSAWTACLVMAPGLVRACFISRQTTSACRLSLTLASTRLQQFSRVKPWVAGPPYPGRTCLTLNTGS